MDNYRNMFESKISAGALRNLAQTFLHDPVIWKVMRRTAWTDIVNWRTKQLNSFAMSQHHALTTTNSTEKKWDLSENCQRFAHKLF